MEHVARVLNTYSNYSNQPRTILPKPRRPKCWQLAVLKRSLT
jgi:hypothetical protein